MKNLSYFCFISNVKYFVDYEFTIITNITSYNANKSGIVYLSLYHCIVYDWNGLDKLNCSFWKTINSNIECNVS